MTRAQMESLDDLRQEFSTRFAVLHPRPYRHRDGRHEGYSDDAAGVQWNAGIDRVRFDWHGTTYHGTHPPLVSHELWARVQDILSGRGAIRRRRARHDFAFSRLITCGHCGCALVGERKKQHYTYYHCTGYRGRCPEPYTREEILEARFTDLLRTLSFDAGIVDWMAKTRRFTQAKDRDIHQQAIRPLEQESARLQRRLENMYDDRLDGRISAEVYDRKSEATRRELTELTATIAGHQHVS